MLDFSFVVGVDWVLFFNRIFMAMGRNAEEVQYWQTRIDNLNTRLNATQPEDPAEDARGLRKYRRDLRTALNKARGEHTFAELNAGLQTGVLQPPEGKFIPPKCRGFKIIGEPDPRKVLEGDHYANFEDPDGRVLFRLWSQGESGGILVTVAMLAPEIYQFSGYNNSSYDNLHQALSACREAVRQFHESAPSTPSPKPEFKVPNDRQFQLFDPKIKDPNQVSEGSPYAYYMMLNGREIAFVLESEGGGRVRVYARRSPYYENYPDDKVFDDVHSAVSACRGAVN